MFDTLAAAQEVNSDQFKAGFAELRTEQRTGVAELRTDIANMESRLIKWIVVAGAVNAVAGAGITIVLLRLLGG